MRVLVAEDDPVTAELLRASLVEFGYRPTVASNGYEALKHVRSGRYRLVVSDWSMPEMSGVELCRQIRRRHASGYIYIILLTSRSGTESVVEGLNAGADDFVTKPFEPEELALRLHAGERILSLESRDVMIFTLAKLAESRDPETGAHLERMREYCRVLASHLALDPKYQDRIDGDYVRLIYLTSPLHDIGKVGIPDSVLLKPGRLTPEEFEVMKQHTVIGGKTLDAALRVRPEVEFLAMGREIAWTHHEWFDGSGYPAGLRGEQIPLSGRIVALADVYDALTTKRVYKPAFSHDDARSMILERTGTQFDPEVVAAFLANESRFLEIRDSFVEDGSDEGFRLRPEPEPDFALL
jgi:putative two-component system response regulator